MTEHIAEYTSPYIERLELKSQYNENVAALNEDGFLELGENGRTVIFGIDGKEYELPRYEAITQAIAEDESRLEEKERQGFTELIIVPLAVGVSRQLKALERKIRAHGEAKTLFSPGNPPTPLDVDLENPLYRWDKWECSDEEGRLLYYPKRFDKNDSGGVTKATLLQQLQYSSFPGFLILLEEPTEIPASGKGETKAGRRQIEAGRSSREYRQDLPKDEIGETIDSWGARNRLHIKKRNETIDDYQGIGKLCYFIGNYDPSSDRVPRGCWYRDYRQANVVWYFPGDRDDRNGSRSAVRIGRVGV